MAEHEANHTYKIELNSKRHKRFAYFGYIFSSKYGSERNIIGNYFEDITRTMKIGKGRFVNRPSKTSKGVYDRFFIYVPTYVAKDEKFPFNEGEEVLVRILKGKLVVEKG